MGKRTIAIADIHGRMDKLTRLLEEIDLGDDVQLVLLGDYTDRGKQSFEVVEALIELSQTIDCVFLKGNHDDILWRSLNGDEEALGLWIMNGGWDTIVSYGFDHDPANMVLPEHHEQFFSNLKLFHETDDFFFCHAGVRPGIDLSHQSPEDLMWIRDPYLASDYDWGKTIVSGHTIQKEPLFSANKILLDTGACSKKTGCGKLTACEVASKKVWSV